MPREAVELAGKTFESKAAARGYLRQIKERYDIGSYLNDEDTAVVAAAVQRHPQAASKVGFGIRAIGIFANGPTLSGQGFGIVRVDGTIARFSYKQCFESQLRSKTDRVQEASRQAVRPSILLWRDKTFEKHKYEIICPLTKERVDPQACEVDHKGTNFLELVNCFLKSEGAAIEEVEIEITDGHQVEAVLRDSLFKRRWIKYHNTNCSLRVLSVGGHRRHHECE